MEIRRQVPRGFTDRIEELVDEVDRNDEVFRVLKEGRPVAVVISPRMYEDLIERCVRADPGFFRPMTTEGG